MMYLLVDEMHFFITIDIVYTLLKIATCIYKISGFIFTFVWWHIVDGILKYLRLH